MTHQNSIRRKREKTTEHRRVNGTRLFNFSVSNMSEAPMLRSKRQSGGSEVSCVVNNYNKLEVGCNSVKNMEFYSTCQNKEYVTGGFRNRHIYTFLKSQLENNSNYVSKQVLNY